LFWRSNRRHMQKRIYLAIFILWLGSLACMQSAPRAATHLPPTKAAADPVEAQRLQQLEQSTALECEVIAAALNVRECGGIDCSVIGWLEYGWTVQAERSPSSAWLKITRGNLTGFVRADYLTCGE